MELFNGQIMGGLLEKSLETATVTEAGWVDIGQGPGSTAGRQIDWLEFKDARAAVVDDVRTIRSHPLVPSAFRSTAISTMSPPVSWKRYRKQRRLVRPE